MYLGCNLKMYKIYESYSNRSKRKGSRAYGNGSRYEKCETNEYKKV
jgi:hypothetical protein